jgi:hypothetical protein
MVDIHEESFPTETLAKSIVHPTGRGGRILSAVIDENPSHHRLPKRQPTLAQM